jgi:hypothetical protein
MRQKPSQFVPCAAELLKLKMFQCGPGGLAGSMFLDGLEDSKHFLVRNDVILTEGLSSDRQEHRYERRNIGVFAGTQVCTQERGCLGGTQLIAQERGHVCRNISIFAGTHAYLQEHMRICRNTCVYAGTQAYLQEHRRICRNTDVFAGTKAYSQEYRCICGNTGVFAGT